jgi:hypothetical protein
MKGWRLAAFAIWGAVAVAAVTVPQSCGQRAPQEVRLRVGETVVVTPLPLQMLPNDLPSEPPRKLLLRFMSGGKEVSTDQGVRIHFIDTSSQPEAYFVLGSDDFQNLHIKTGCASSDVSLLDNAVGAEVLICDGSLDVHKANLIELHLPNGKKKQATGVIPEVLENDLFSARVVFY